MPKTPLVQRGRSKLLGAVWLSALGALAAVVLLGGGSSGRRELLSGNANDLWATSPGRPAVDGVSAVAGAMNVFKSIAAGAPLSVHPAAIPHRLTSILKGVKLLENRLKDFESGEHGWLETVHVAETSDNKVLQEMGDKEMHVFRDEGDVHRFLTTPGPPGDTGPVGLRGIRGMPGMIGWQGLKGRIGIEGDSGPRGNSGSPGPLGPSGDAGPSGMEGPMGSEGQRGAIGSAGEDGQAGIRGRQGAQGENGQMGQAGTTVVGLSGPTGPRGKHGAMGILGSAGMEGASGLEGHIGIAGGNGIPGLKGFYGGPFGNGRNIAKAMKKASRRTNTQSLLKSRSQKLDTIWL